MKLAGDEGKVDNIGDTTSYSTLIETMSLSCTVFEI